MEISCQKVGGYILKRNKRRSHDKYWLYIGLFNNLDFNLQTELRLLTYKQFCRVKNKDELIDLYRKILYNSNRNM